MLKKIAYAVIGAFVATAIGAAFAVTGTPPGTGFQLVDSAWLTGLAAGQNQTYQAGITAAGSSQATGAQLPTGVAIMQVDTTGSSTGVNLPPALAGTEFALYNNGANTLTVYPAVANNPITGAQDTINNTTSATITTHTSLFFASAKNGIWFSK